MAQLKFLSARAGRFLDSIASLDERDQPVPLQRAVLVLCLVIIGLLSVLVIGGWRIAGYIAGWSDLASYHLPKYQYVAERLASGSLPLWNPYEFAGIPFLASLQPGVYYPPVLFFYSLLSGELAHVGFFVLHIGIAAVASLLLMRAFGCRFWPSLLAALWVTQPLWLVRVYDHPNFIAALCWIPLLLLYLRRCILTPSLRAATALAMLAAMQFLAGYPPITLATVYLLMLSVPFWLFEARATSPGRLPRALVALLVAGTVCVLVVAAQLLPTAELALLTNRENEANAIHELLLSSRDSYTAFFPGGIPQLTFGASAFDFWSTFGPVLIGLCVAALLIRRRSVPVWFLFCAVVLCGLLPYSAYTKLPLYGQVRWAFEWHLIAPQMVFALAGFGLQALLSRSWVRPRHAAAWTVAIALLSLGWNWRAVDARWLRPQPTAAMPVPDWVKNYCLLGDARFRSFWPQGQSRGSLFAARLRSIGGYDQSLLPARTARLIDTIGIGNGGALPRWAMSTALNHKIVARMALRCLITPVAPILERGDFFKFAPADSALKVYIGMDAVPRARLVRRARFAATSEDALNLLRSGEGGEAIIEGPPGELPDDACIQRVGRSVITKDEAEEVRVRTLSSCASYLILADTYVSGWTATLDGVEVPIHFADYAFRAVTVPAGRHEVVFRYAPWTIRVGLFLSILGVGIALGLVLVPQRHDPLRGNVGDGNGSERVGSDSLGPSAGAGAALR